jgi:spoIIIJ-associated protein
MNQQQSLEYAVKYLEDILSFFGVNVSVDAKIDGDVIELDVPATEESRILIGKNAETLRSFQYLVSMHLRSQDSEITRVNVDIADYKKQRAEKLAEKARGWIEEVRATGSSHVAYINAADRRIVHQVATEYSDIETFSEGEGRDRRIVIAQASS